MKSRTPVLLLPLALAACTSAPEPAPEPQAEPAEAAAPATRTADIKRLEYEVEIAAPVEKVWDVMLSPEGYTKWTSAFTAGSYYEGTFAEGERIHLLAPGGNGMVAEIAEYRLHEIVSLKHLGYVLNGVEDTTSEGVRSWAPAYENFLFESVDGGTLVTIEHDVFASAEDFMNDVWPRALDALKSLCEAD